MVMHLACVTLKMSMPEALAAATINAAYALNHSQSHGSLEPGKQGDLLIINAPRYTHHPQNSCFNAWKSLEFMIMMV